MTIQSEIENWNGKSADDIGTVYQRHHKSDSFASDLVDLIGIASTCKGATWLLKRLLEDNGQLQEHQVNLISKSLKDLACWESKLHLLQCLPHLPIKWFDRQQLESFLRVSLMETNKFVRAWAYNGFYELALQYPEYEQEVRQFLEMALEDEAPSVKARIRNIMKKGFRVNRGRGSGFSGFS